MNKTECIVQSIEQAIRTRALQAGHRLPSIRVAADQYKVSKNTIVEAYARLTALQVISAKQGSGFFVAGKFADYPMAQEAVIEASDTISLLRAQLSQQYDIRPGDGRPPMSWMGDALPKRIDTSLLVSEESDQSGYGNPLGNTLLRELLARRFTANSAPIPPSQIVTTFGANHALDLIIRRFLAPGQTVFVDDPGYYPLYAKLKLAKVNMIGIARHAKGPDMNALECLAKKHQPKIFFTQSTGQNPTGTSYDLQHAHGVLQIAARYNFRIVDDDPFVDMNNHSVNGNRIWELDGFRSVILVGTHSKLLSASFRSGHIIADIETINALTELKVITSVNSSRMSEMLIAHMMKSGRYDRHLKKLGQRLKEAQAACLQILSEFRVEPFSLAPTGFYTLIRFPDNVPSERVRELANKRRIFIAPGSYFTLAQNEEQPMTLRINFSRSANQRFFSFLKDLTSP